MLQVSDLLCEIFFFSLATFKIVYLFIALYIKKREKIKMLMKLPFILLGALLLPGIFFVLWEINSLCCSLAYFRCTYLGLLIIDSKKLSWDI